MIPVLAVIVLADRAQRRDMGPKPFQLLAYSLVFSKTIVSPARSAMDGLLPVTSDYNSEAVTDILPSELF